MTLEEKWQRIAAPNPYAKTTPAGASGTVVGSQSKEARAGRVLLHMGEILEKHAADRISDYLRKSTGSTRSYAVVKVTGRTVTLYANMFGLDDQVEAQELAEVLFGSDLVQVYEHKMVPGAWTAKAVYSIS